MVSSRLISTYTDTGTLMKLHLNCSSVILGLSFKQERLISQQQS